MVHYSTSDIDPISKFEYSWRLTDRKWDDLPDYLLRRLVPMGDERAGEIGRAGEALRDAGPFALRVGSYHAVKAIALVGTSERERESVRDWFVGLPIGEDERVYVNWARIDPYVAIVTDWGAFTEMWGSLWYPFDVVNVFDDSLDWAVLLGPEEFAVYAIRGPASSLSPDNPECAYELVRTTAGARNPSRGAPDH